MSTPDLTRTRQTIADKVRELRKERRLSQVDLSRRLQLSQSRLSEIERGDGSFSAEQFLAILKLFNVSATHFETRARDANGELQNALARFGARHLRATDAAPNEAAEDLGYVVRETLVSGSPRLLAALSPVLVENADRINLAKAYVDLHDVGFERRLAWVADNVVDGLRKAPTSNHEHARADRRASVVLSAFLDFVCTSDVRYGNALDVLDRDIRSPQTLTQVKREASAISRRWHIATSLQPSDFLEALQAARAG